MIAGEIKRYLRDDGLLKVSRSLKENYYRVYKKREELEYSLGREPMITELSKALEIACGRSGDDYGGLRIGGVPSKVCLSGRKQ